MRSVPRKHRKYVTNIINNYNYDRTKFKSFGEYLWYLKVGSEDGWINTNTKEYRALNWLTGIYFLLEDVK